MFEQCSVLCFCSVQFDIYIYIVFSFSSKNLNSLFHPYRNHQVVSNLEITHHLMIPIRMHETDCCGFLR